MASVGEVSIGLSLDRSQFDRDLRELEGLRLEPLKLDLELDAKSFHRQLKDLTKDLDCIPLEICAHLNADALKADVSRTIEAVQKDLQLQLHGAVEAIVKVESSPRERGGLDSGSDAATQKLEAGFEKVAQKFESALSNALSAALSPFKNISTGFFENIGTEFSKQLSRGAVNAIQQGLGVSFQEAGKGAGNYIARTINEIRGKEGGGGAAGGGSAPVKPIAPKIGGGGGAATDLQKELRTVANTLANVNKIFSDAGGGVGTFAKSAIAASEDALKLASALTKLYGAIEFTNKNSVLPGGGKSTNKANPVVTAEQVQTRPARGFLKGDLTQLKPEDARSQVEAVRSRLEKQLTALQVAPQTEQTRKKIVSLINSISQLEARIATDVANSELPKAVRQSLGQLKGTNSKLAETKRTLEAEAARIGASSRLPGFAKGIAGAAAGASVLGAGSAFAAPGAGVGGLGVLGALPFDPTLGLAAGGIAGSLAAARLTPGLLRKAGAGKVADVLETDVTAIASDAIRNVFRSLRSSLSGVVGRTKGALTTPLQQGIGEISGQLARSLQLPRGPLSPVPRSNLPQKMQELPPIPSNYWDRFFRGLEARFFRSPLFSGNVSPRDRRSITAEATGFLASGALLAGPGTTAAFLATPLLAALTPLITTVGLVTSAIAPLVGTVSQTLQQIEPLQARLQYASGSPSAAASDRSFVEGIVGKYNIGALPALDQFSKLAAAAKGTRLEGMGLKNLFEGIAVASKALQLNTQDLNLVLFAFGQIITKNKLSAEELRQQLGERFVGVTGIFAKALNLTAAEFNELLEQGKLVADDVLPKLGDALKREYGQAAVAASGNFLSALTKVENSIFKLKEGVARTLAPLFTFVADSIGNALSSIASVADKIVPIFGVVLAGISAQFFVGLTQVLEGSGLVAKMTAFLVPAFSRLFVTLTPFLSGILADFLDDVVGAQTSVMDNLVKGSYNAVVTLILSAQSAQSAVAGIFSSLPSLPPNNVFSEVGKTLSGIGEKLKPFGGLIRGTGVELVSLTLILAQTLVLLQQGLNLVLARFGVTVASLATSFVSAAKSGALFKSVLTTLTAGLSGFQLAATAGVAALVLFFAKADFTDELGTSFDKLGNTVTASLDRIRENLKETSKDLDLFKNRLPELKSKGFDLTVGIAEAFGEKPYRSDDLIKLIRDFKQSQSTLNTSSIQALIQSIGGPIGLFGGLGFQSVDKNSSTLAEKFFKDNLKRAQNEASRINQSITESGLLNGGFDSSVAGKNLAEIKAIDVEIKKLQGQRIDLLDGADVNTDAVKKQIADIDAKIQKKLKQREPLKLPIERIKNSILEESESLKSTIDAINQSSFPEFAKKQLRDALQPAIDKTEEAKRKLEELKLIDLSPLGNQFSDVVKQIEKTDRALEKALSRGQVESANNQAKIQSDLVAGKITPDVAARSTADEDLRALKVRSRNLESFLKARRAEFKELLAIPEPNPDQLQAIDRNRKEIESKELELAQNRLTIGQKVVEGRRQIEERILRDFQKANAKAAEVIGRAETQRLTQIKERQLKGLITPEQAETETARSGATTAAANFAEANRQLQEFLKLKKTGRISDEEARTRETELQKALGDANLRRVDAEINQQQQLRSEAIRGIEERAQGQKNLYDLAISGIEQQRAAQDLLNSSIDRTKELETSRFDLTKALSDAAVSAGERQVEAANRALELSRRLDGENLDAGVRSQIQNQLSAAGFGSTELEILARRQQIEADLSAKRLAALETEQQFQQRSLELDLQRQSITARTAVFEAQIAQLRAQQAGIDARAALEKANKSKDELAIQSAQIGVNIADKQLDLSNKQLENARENLQIQGELAENAIATQRATQQAALDQATAAENARKQSEALERAEASAGRSSNRTFSIPTTSPSIDVGSTTSASIDVDPDKKQSKRGLLEQARANMSAMLGAVTRNYLPPDQSRSIGLNRATSAESELKRSLGLNPFETAEAYFKRPRSLYFGADSSGSFEQLNLKYKPTATNFEELNERYAPASTTTGYDSFVSGLKEANREVVNHLKEIVNTNKAAMASPRQLYVSSPEPVSDAVKIFSEISRQAVINAGL